jgi:signal-transduction protein with cAMP-binding, CBS, and nucleotidyltransferase domain
MKRLVRDLIRQKKGLSSFAQVKPEASIFEALTILENSKSSAILVIKDKKLMGIFSERDFARATINKGMPLSASVASAMTPEVYYVDPCFTLEECLHVMSNLHVRHLPVIENGEPIALLSMRHIMQILVDDKESQIRDLTTYITGSSQIVEATELQRNPKVLVHFSTQSQEEL